MAAGKLTKDSVLAWLDKHPDVLAGLLPGGPENDQGVVDFQRHLIDRLRGSLSQRTARFRAKLAQIVALAEAGDIEALRAFEINPVSSSPKAIARYRDLCVIAITARTGAAG